MKPPAFQFYPADWLSSQRVQMMTLEEEGAYIRLLCYCWSHGSIPSDPIKIARLLGKNVSTDVVTTVQRMFTVRSNDESTMGHERLDLEKQRQEARKAQAADAGRKSAENRKNGTKSQRDGNGRSNGRSNSVPTDVPTDDEVCVERKSNPSSSSSTSGEEEDKKETLPPAVGEAPVKHETLLANCGQYGVTRECADSWWLANDAAGWLYRDRPLVNWLSSLKRYSNAWVNNESRREQQNQRPEPRLSKPTTTPEEEERRRKERERNQQADEADIAALRAYTQKMLARKSSTEDYEEVEG